ncbi:MAG: ABC transporter permease [Clostridia bacterium]|nr:ABC transporter permease [Clostridia bacterium]
MTSHKSLSNKKKGAFYSFVSALKTAMLPCGFLTLLYVGLFGIIPFMKLYWYENDFDYSAGKEITRSAKEYYKFLVFMDGDEEEICYLVLAMIAVISLLVGIAVFRFTADKRTVNVYYSLGIKRSTLFYTRYFAGALVLCAAVAVGIISSYIVNLIFVGGSWQLSLVLFYLYSGLSLFSLLIYTVTAAVFSSVGTISEGVLYSAGVLALPTVVLMSAQNLISSLLSNTVFGLDIIPYELKGDYYYWGNTRESLISRFSAYNPVLFFYNALVKYGVGYKEDGKLLIGANSDEWVFPSVFAVLPWFFVVIAAAVIGGTVLFRLRKAEHCGFLNTNKVLSTVVLFELMFFASTLFLSEIEYSDKVSIFLLSAGLALMMYILFEIFLERNVRLFFKKLWKLPAAGAVIAAVFAVFSTGLFGYEMRVPQTDEIQSVSVSVPVSHSVISLRNMGMMIDDGLFKIGSFNWHYELPALSGTDALKTVTGVHKEAAKREDGDYVSTVSYTLKNGKSLKRKMYIGNDDIKKLFTLFDSPECKEKIAEIINAVYPENPTPSQLTKAGTSMFRYENATVTAISKNMFDANRINLTETEFNALKQAVLADLQARSAESYYNADKPQTGILRFTTDVPRWIDESYVPEKKDREFSERLESVPGEYTDFGIESYDAYGRYDVLIDEGMTNTLAFLQSIGASACFEAQKQIKSVSFRSAAIFSEYSGQWSRESTRAASREFFADSMGTSAERGFWENDENFVEDYSENIITDSEKIRELDALMRLHAYNYGEGYWCLVAYTDGNYSSRFLPQSLAPEYVTGFKYVHE